MTLAIDISRLLGRITGAEDPRDHQILMAAEFARRGDRIAPIAIERWRQRGSISTPRLLMLLQIAKEQKLAVDLLDYTMPADQVEGYKESERQGKARAAERLRVELEQGGKALRKVRREKLKARRRTHEARA